eukprot:gnl/MRDRNA2_/MRDRNA2_143157_c0_seq1.p1 gnl/MRDRNA2_/MRDRNA2_143157_c0~~gnl/MRDRNA2_/MRDRNA2_143157_c0_seq1.p1  ORF type:complete len:295 (+),score=37.39 gnl/MRDRNA2_/MRDRNA2_143157_c0_seq1:28-885(+)
MASECLAHGMHVVLSDIRKETLEKALQSLCNVAGNGLRVEGFICDVTSVASVEALLSSVRQAFPRQPIQFVAANAGVLFPGSTVLTGTPEEWDLTYRVNVLGVAHTLRTFVPVLMAQHAHAIVEITASIAGVLWGGTGPYGASKHAALSIGEALWSELNIAPGSPLDRISIVALCPGIAKTDLLESRGQKARGKERDFQEGDRASEATAAMFDNMWNSGMPAEYVAAQVFQHAAEGKFYCILPNTPKRDGMGFDHVQVVKDRFEAMQSGRIQDHRTGFLLTKSKM